MTLLMLLILSIQISPAQVASTQNSNNSSLTSADVSPSTHQIIKEKFIEGDPIWMTPVLVCLLLGLTIVIERILTLYAANIKLEQFIHTFETTITTQGVDAAKTLCENTKGPVAKIYYEGIDRLPEGIEKVEAAMQAHGSVQMGQMEKGLVWISLFIALSPMLGFLGTVVGMIQAFDTIAIVGDISPTIVADGIKVALLTTVAGLIVAIILQVFYNLIVSKIDGISNDMEQASIKLIDILVKNKLA